MSVTTKSLLLISTLLVISCGGTQPLPPSATHGVPQTTPATTAVEFQGLVPIRESILHDPVYIVPHEVAATFWLPKKGIGITTGMLALLSSEDDLVFLIAHEACHDKLGHTQALKDNGVRGSTRVIALELEADSCAFAATRAAGFCPNNTPRLFSNLTQKFKKNGWAGAGSELELRREALVGLIVLVPLCQ